MRLFILLANKAHTTPDFSMENLYESGRMDIVINTIANALFLSHEIRKDSLINVVLNGPFDPPKTICFDGSKLEGFAPNEKSIISAVIECLKAGTKLKLNEEKEIFPGIEVSKKAFETLLKENSEKKIYYLHEKGEDISEINFKNNSDKDKIRDAIFIIGDSKGIMKIQERFLKRIGAKKVSLGPKKLLASQCPVIVHNQLDKLS